MDLFFLLNFGLLWRVSFWYKLNIRDLMATLFCLLHHLHHALANDKVSSLTLVFFECQSMNLG